MSESLCGVCGNPSRAAFRAPQPEIAPDLDMRPGEPARSTLRDWIQVCSRCGAAAPDLSALPSTARAVVEFGRVSHAEHNGAGGDAAVPALGLDL